MSFCGLGAHIGLDAQVIKGVVQVAIVTCRVDNPGAASIVHQVIDAWTVFGHLKGDLDGVSSGGDGVTSKGFVYDTCEFDAQQWPRSLRSTLVTDCRYLAVTSALTRQVRKATLASS